MKAKVTGCQEHGQNHSFEHSHSLSRSNYYHSIRRGQRERRDDEVFYTFISRGDPESQRRI